MIAPTVVLTIAMFLACLRLPRVKAASPSERGFCHARDVPQTENQAESSADKEKSAYYE